MKHRRELFAAVSLFAFIGSSTLIGIATADEPPLGFDPTFSATTEWLPPPTDVLDSGATSESEMKAYAERIGPSDVTIEMLPIRGGEFLLGSPRREDDREDDEGPQVRTKIEPFWMGQYEITWAQFNEWADLFGAKKSSDDTAERSLNDRIADAVTRPSRPMADITFEMGKGDDYPAVAISQLAARCYCKWLSAKTGRFYRLPTEAEWEYACRAGTVTAYSYGDDPDELEDYGWFFDNGDDRYHKVGELKPNPWGLYDMHGNVSEWVLDRYDEDRYSELAGGTLPVVGPLLHPTTRHPCVARGGSWDDDPERLRCAARRASEPRWLADDPRQPHSIWVNTKSRTPGCRTVRPLRKPTAEEAALYEPNYEEMRIYLRLGTKKEE